MQNIADRAGVSRMTVSLALRNDPQLPEKTRKRIQELAQEMGYRPNPLVNALMSSIRERHGISSRVGIALIAHDKCRAFHSIKRFLDGAQSRARQLGCRSDVFWVGDDSLHQQQLNRILKSRGVSGLVISPMFKPGRTLDIEWERFATGAIGYSLASPSLHRAVNHQLHTIRLAMRCLHERGYQRIGLALEQISDERTDHNWSAGFLGHQYRCATCKPSIPMLLTDQLTEATFSEWFLTHRPDAIIAGHRVVRDWLANLKLQIPSEVAFALLNRDPTYGDFAGIDQGPQLVGAAAVDLVIGQLLRNERGIPENPRVVLVEGTWVGGPTVAQRKKRGKVGKFDLTKPKSCIL